MAKEPPKPTMRGECYDIVDAAAVQNNTAPLFSVHAAAMQVGLRPSEMKDRNRALLANRNRRR